MLDHRVIRLETLMNTMHVMKIIRMTGIYFHFFRLISNEAEYNFVDDFKIKKNDDREMRG